MDNPENLKNITNWINQQGYPFEMYCSSVLSQNGFVMVPSLHYEDFESKKVREIDIIAHLSTYVNNVTFNFTLVIECKVCKKHPWLLFAQDSNYHNQEHILRNAMATVNGNKLIVNAKNAFSQFSLFKLSPKQGFNLTECFTTGKDTPYEAMMTTSNACEFLITKSNLSRKRFCNLYFPVIALDAELYLCETSPSQEIDLKIIPTGQVLTFRSFAERTHTLHTIVTKDHFQLFVRNLRNEIDNLISNLQTEFHTISTEHPSPNMYGGFI